MADGAVNFLLDKITNTFVQEVSLLGDAGNDIKSIKGELESMRSFIEDAEQSKEMSIQTWVSQVRELAYEVEGIIDEFLYYREYGNPTRKGYKTFVQGIVHLPKSISSRRHISSELQKIKAKVHEISERSKRYGFSEAQKGENGSDRWLHHYGRQSSIVAKDDDMVGMDENAEKLYQLLTEDELRRTIISVVGMGGLGKTTLVTEVYNDNRIKLDFFCCAWISVTQTCGFGELLRSMIKELFETKQLMIPSGLGSMNHTKLLKCIFNFLHQKRYLIVLDDVWSIDLWNDIRSAFPNNQNGSRIILTTRNENVPDSVGIGSRVYRLGPLGYNDALTLFCKKAFWNDPNHSCPRELQTLTESIVKKCDGLPLAIMAIGSLMSSRKKNVKEWNMVYESLNWQFSNNPKLERVKTILLLSFKDLPFYLKHCFLYCCVLRNGSPIKRKKLVRLWVAEGFILERKGMTMEEVAEDYLSELILRNMIQVTETNDGGRVKTCRVHDVMLELAMTKSCDENFCATYNGSEPMLQGKTRSLSIYNRGKDVKLSRTTSQHLRSFFVFDTDMCSSFSLNSFASKFKFLRVLELEGIFLETVPNSIVDLFNLRYLNLRGTKIKKLPKPMERLMNLETLDIRNTYVTRVPNEISKLQKLRHLYVNAETSNLVCSSMQAPKEIWNVQSLQTLAGVEAEEELVTHIRNLTELKSLDITRMKAIHGPALCTSIEMMTSLLRLNVKAISEGEELRLEALSHPPLFLQKLTLTGRLNTVPSWIGSLANLTHLYLRSSQVEDENLLSLLHLLSTLVLLELKKAYNGKILHFKADWFPRLSRLNLLELQHLDTVKFEEKALPNIKELHLIHCPQLRELPEGIRHLASLQKLQLEEMHPELILRNNTSRGLQAVLQNIPTVNLVTSQETPHS